MTLIVETGAGLATAESYLSAVDADAYHANFGNTTWADLDPDVKESALRRATQYLTGVYRMRWAGSRMTSAQALDWPRAFVPKRDVIGGYRSYPSYYDNTSVPQEVKQACAVMALKAVQGDLAPDLERQTASEKVGSLQVDYVAGAPEYTRYRAIDLMLKPLLGSTGIGLVRS